MPGLRFSLRKLYISFLLFGQGSGESEALKNRITWSKVVLFIYSMHTFSCLRSMKGC
jgi:hypothetical protein